MPDILGVLTKRWKFIVLLTLAASLLALLVSALRPKQYAAIATAVPANSLLADKARIFNQNIQSLYPELGAPDELDRIEGTAKLDTVFLALVDSFHLASRDGADKSSPGNKYEAAIGLKKNSDIRRSAYGELKIKVWDKDAATAANLANAILFKLNEIHGHVQNANNALLLKKMKQDLAAKEQELDSLEAYIVSFKGSDSKMYDLGIKNDDSLRTRSDSKVFQPQRKFQQLASYASALTEQVREYYRIISQYEISVKTNPDVLIAVEYARPSLYPDRPKLLQTTLFAFGASLIFSFLLAVFAEGRKRTT